MLQLLILLAFAYAQDNHGTYPAYAWAVAYGVLSMLMTAMFGGQMMAVMASGMILTVYAWGYFVVLRRAGDNLVLWLMVCVAGLVVPLFLLV